MGQAVEWDTGQMPLDSDIFLGKIGTLVESKTPLEIS